MKEIAVVLVVAGMALLAQGPLMALTFLGVVAVGSFVCRGR